MEGWQPIETAPRDTRIILGTKSGLWAVGELLDGMSLDGFLWAYWLPIPDIPGREMIHASRSTTRSTV